MSFTILGGPVHHHESLACPRWQSVHRKIPKRFQAAHCLQHGVIGPHDSREGMCRHHIVKHACMCIWTMCMGDERDKGSRMRATEGLLSKREGGGAGGGKSCNPKSCICLPAQKTQRGMPCAMHITTPATYIHHKSQPTCSMDMDLLNVAELALHLLQDAANVWPPRCGTMVTTSLQF